MKKFESQLEYDVYELILNNYEGIVESFQRLKQAMHDNGVGVVDKELMLEILRRLSTEAMGLTLEECHDILDDGIAIDKTNPLTVFFQEDVYDKNYEPNTVH